MLNVPSVRPVDLKMKAIFFPILPFLILVYVIVLIVNNVGILKLTSIWPKSSSEFVICNRQNVSSTTTVESRFEASIIDKFNSTCSSKADQRGFHQNVIAYSLYGNFSDPNLFNRYVDPIETILTNISKSYPGTYIY